MNNFLDIVKKKLNESLKIEKIQIIDNTSKHTKHKNFQKDKYHLCIHLESKYLRELGRLKAQREVMNSLKDEMATKIHALEIKIT